MRIILVMAIVGLFAAINPKPVYAQGLTTEWLTSDQYQAYYQTQIPGSGWVPVYAEADVFNGRVYYFARFEQRYGVGFATHHGLSDASFAQRDQQYRSQGYVLVHHQRFTGASRPHNQAIWHR